MARALVAELGLQPGDPVVEIGPGLGALTRWIHEAGASLIVIEKDRRLAAWLRDNYEAVGVDVRNMDALEFDIRDLFVLGPVTVAGNLPYSISTPLLFEWTEEPSPVYRLLVTLQLELAERLAAVPRTPEYGELSVVLQRHFRIRFVRKLPPTVFLPEPGVMSGTVLLERHPPGRFPICDEPTFRRLLSEGFAQRRKQLRKAMERCGVDWTTASVEIGASPTARAEELTVEQWVALARIAVPVGHAQNELEEIFDVVDEHDAVVGQATRGEVHAGRLRHRAVHIFVFNTHGELWLQRRSHLKDKCPGLWDSSAAGHLDAGESYEAAALREVQEEMGVEPRNLLEIGRLPASERTGMEFVGLYRAEHDGPFVCPPAEIDGGRFFRVEQITEWIGARPQDFAPGFLVCWERCHPPVVHGLVL